MRVALFGGSFDPPHVGHLLAMAYVLGCARVERLLMVPCSRHPFEKQLSPFADRLAMCELAARPFGERVEVSDVEARLGGDSLTLRTVKALGAAGVEVWRWSRAEVESSATLDAGVARDTGGVPDVAVLAITDGAIGEVAERLLAEGLVPHRAVLLHTARALPPGQAFASVRG